VALLDKLHHGDLGSPGSLEAAFVSTPLGQLATTAVGRFQQALLSFIMDLVQMKLGSRMSGHVLNILCVAVFRVAKHIKASILRHEVSEEAGEDEEMPEAQAPVSMASICLSPVDIYEAVKAVLPRLHLCVRAISLVPDVEKKLTEDDLSNEVFSLDIQVLDAALDLMDPAGSQMLTPSARHDWGGRVTNLSTLLKQLEGLLLSGEAVSPEDQTRMAVMSSKCQRLEIMKLLLEHVLQPDVNPLLQETVGSNIRLIFAALKNPDFSKGPQTFRKLRHAIDNCCRKGGAALFGLQDVNECVLCLESIKEPVILPCGHIGCSGCLKENFQVDGADRVCPKKGCRAPIPADFKFQSDAMLEVAAVEHIVFKRKLSQFFLEMIQRFVFVKDKMPHQVHSLNQNRFTVVRLGLIFYI
jgi:hypothetical protein